MTSVRFGCMTPQLGTLSARGRHGRPRLRRDQGRSVRAGGARADRGGHRPAAVEPREAVPVACEAPDDELLLADGSTPDLRDGDTQDALRSVRRSHRRHAARAHRLGRARRCRSATIRRWRSRARPIRRCASRATTTAGWRKPWWTSEHGHRVSSRGVSEYEWEIAAAGRDARARR